LKVLPKVVVFDDGDMKGQIEAIANYALQQKDVELIEKTKKITHNCKRLVQDGLISDDDRYAALRKDIIQELLNYEIHITKSTQDLERLKQVRAAIQEHNVFLQQQVTAYEQYLGNVRVNCATSSLSSLATTASIDPATPNPKVKPQPEPKPSSKKKGAVKLSHTQLEKDGVIITSEVPEERRSNIFFSFASNTPGTFDVVVMYKSRVISEIRLQLDELLEKQHNNAFELETDFLKLNVNLLIYLLNKTFIS